MRALALALALAAPARAATDAAALRDARRFGLDKPATALAGAGRARVQREVQDFNQAHRGRWNLRFGPQGVGPAGAPTARLTAMDEAASFLAEHGRALGLDPSQLVLELARSNAGAHHLLYRQVVQGVPVEFATVKVHLLSDGSVEDFNSSFQPGVTASPVPAVSEQAAAAAVAADLGGAPPAGGTLVFLPPPAGGPVRLAWKFRAATGGWVYYVDARTGGVLLRYNGLDYVSCVTSGTVSGLVYDLDPNHQSGAAARPFAHEKVYVLDASTYVLTDSNGFFCSQTAGKIFTNLQGPFFSIADFKGPAALYNNGGALWQTFATPLQSDHPYANNAVVYSTINAPSGSGALEVLTQFDTLDVGQYTLSGGDISIDDDDKVEVLDPEGDELGTYLGQRSLLRTVASPGSQLRLRLKTNASGQHNGFDISISSYLYFPASGNPGVTDNATSTFTWSRSMTYDGTDDEANLFYQLNEMHDYFRNGPDASDSADIDKVVPVMARVGPDLANAFYDPVHQDLTIGDFNQSGGGDSQFAVDATVIHHEYTHAMVDTIFPIINIGQFGALSEALADYFSASSLNDPHIGAYVGGAFGEASLRQLDCQGNPPCYVFPTNWTGEIHQDSPAISQALWEIRRALIAAPPVAGQGQACADDLVFNALFYFPDSFADFEQAMLDVSARSSTLGLPCGANGGQDGLIESKFAAHGVVIPSGDADPYEPNDGPSMATDITTMSVLSARIYPAADLDYYSFGAGAGPITLTLTLPHALSAPSVYTAYELTLVDSGYNIVKTVAPRFDVNSTLSGNCPGTDCQTTQASVVLNYYNPAAAHFYVMVSAPPSDGGTVSGTNSTAFYSLSASLPASGPVATSIVSASFDHDRIDFSAPAPVFVTGQPLHFDHARLLDQDHAELPGTRTDGAAPWLTMVSSTSASGTVSGVLQLTAGFANRFPAVGNVYLEVFGVDPLGHIESLGASSLLALTASGASLTAYNNLFNPARGEHAIVKWSTTGAGHVRLRLYTVAGQLVTTLLDEDRPAGEGSVDWYGVNSGGQRVASGVYLLHIDAPGLEETKKIVVVK